MNSISRQMAMVKFYVRRIYHNLKVFAKWAVFSSITGLVRRCIQHIVCGMFEIGDAVSDSKPMDDPAITACWYCYCIFVSYFSL